MAILLSACAAPLPLEDTRGVDFDRAAALASVNAFRAENGLSALRFDERLTKAAETQSAAMAARGKMDHAVAGRLPERVVASGYRWSTTAENIANGQRDYASAMQAWEQSPGHRRNLLNKDVSDLGLGAVKAEGSGRIYWTQIFAAPKAVAPAGPRGAFIPFS